jgi:predicted Zn-dependent protease
VSAALAVLIVCAPSVGAGSIQPVKRTAGKASAGSAVDMWYGGSLGYQKAIDDWNARISKARNIPPSLMPALGNTPSQQRQHQVGGDYFSEMVANGSERWSANRIPLRVFMDTSGAGYRASFPQLFAQSMNEWAAASGGKIQWTQVADPSAADILVEWTSRVEGGEPAGETRNSYVHTDSGDKLIVRSRVTLVTQQRGAPITDDEMKKTSLHEIGHALGLRHCSNQNDIMYWQSNGAQLSSLGPRDASTISRLYAR